MSSSTSRNTPRRRPERLRPQTQLRPDVEQFEDWIHRYTVAISNQPGEVRRLAVHQDQIHLGVRNAQALDQILYRGGHSELSFDGPKTLAREKMVVQFRVKSKRSA